MRNIVKSLFLLILASSAVCIGYFMGKESVMSQIPDFQEEAEEKTLQG